MSKKARLAISEEEIAVLAKVLPLASVALSPTEQAALNAFTRKVIQAKSLMAQVGPEGPAEES